MTRALERPPSSTLDISPDVPFYQIVDMLQQDLLDEVEELRRNESKVNSRITANLAQRAVILSDFLPPLQSENLMVSVAAVTKDAETVALAHSKIDELFSDNPKRKDQEHTLANLTINFTDKETSVAAAGIRALCKDQEVRGIDPEAALEKMMTAGAILNENARRKQDQKNRIQLSSNVDIPTGALLN